MMYNKATKIVIRIGVAIGPVGLTHNLGRLLGVRIKNTSLMAEFRYRLIKMLLIHHSTSIIKRGQHHIPHFTTISCRGHYQYPRRTLNLFKSILFKNPECPVYRHLFASVMVKEIRSQEHLQVDSSPLPKSRQVLPIHSQQPYSWNHLKRAEPIESQDLRHLFMDIHSAIYATVQFCACVSGSIII